MNTRYYFDTELNDDEAYGLAFHFAKYIAENDAKMKRIIYLVGSKNSTGWLDRLYGSDTVKRLHKGMISGQFSVKIETLRTYRNNYGNASDIVISCGIDSKELFQVEDYRNVGYIIAIPWLKDNIKSWVATKRPSILEQTDKGIVVKEPDTIDINPIIKEAFKELTSVINNSTGINHPSDNSRAKTYVKSLFKYEDNLDPDLICSYLVNELQWDVRHANDIRKLIDTLKNGKYFVGGEKTGLQHHYKRWKENLK